VVPEHVSVEASKPSFIHNAPQAVLAVYAVSAVYAVPALQARLSDPLPIDQV